uniref:Zgc:63972 n=1 Tax=Sander lucioperca TaxID=283035 RepID=A0A8D0D9R1_SANLU
MTFVATSRMEWLFQRCSKESVFLSVFRSMLLISCLLLVLSVSMYPGLQSIGVQLHSAVTGSYVPGHHSVLLVNSPNKQAAKDIGRAIMERRLAASINILSRTSTMYYWNGEIQDASEVLMVSLLTKSVHPYENPEVLSFPVEDGSLAYMKWMDEAIPEPISAWTAAEQGN